MTKPKALFAACNHWTSPYQVGSHQLAKVFARNGWNVFFISDPVSPLHLFSKEKELVKERLRINNEKGISDLNQSLFAYVPFSLLTPQNEFLLKSNFVFNYWHRLTSPNLKRFVKDKCDNFDLLYVDSVYQKFWLENIEYKKSIMRIADNNRAYGNDYKAYIDAEKYIVSKVDAVIYSAENLKGYVDDLNPRRSFYLSNGVEWEHFNNKIADEPGLLSQIPKPRIIYVGETRKRFDKDAIKYTAQKMPGLSFVIIGNSEPVASEFKEQENIYMLGIINYNDLPGYLQYSDVGIIPLDLSINPNLINSINPIKLYQYLASGLPVISSEWESLFKLNPPVFTYKTKEGIPVLLENLLNKKHDKNYYKEYAKKHDWQKRYEKIASFLELKNN
ncbi:MAG: glycosyltransferase [Ignavibacteria bacterium]|jgi:hypothetical protein